MLIYNFWKILGLCKHGFQVLWNSDTCFCNMSVMIMCGEEYEIEVLNKK